jgi:hypothetical protein
MYIQSINEYLKEGCGIITSKQPQKTGFKKLVIKKSVIGSETTEVSLPHHESITFFSHKQKSNSELTILLPGKNGKSKMTALFCLVLNRIDVISYLRMRK